MSHRAGLTLVEVLVAIFIMGVGLLAIMTLFPLGILNYGQAMQDDRVAQAAANAAAIANLFDLRNDSTISATFAQRSVSAIYVDPWYASIGVGPLGGVIPRVSVPTPTRAALYPQQPYWPPPYAQWFSLMDDFVFDKNGAPTFSGNATAAGSIKNEGYYTWCYMLRRVPTTALASGVVIPGRTSEAFFTDMAIVVYKGRTTQSQDGENSMAINPVTITPGVDINTLVIPAASGKPAIRKTGWILDPNTGFFYRVISNVQDNSGNSTLEIQTPFRALPSNSSYTVRSIVVMENVAEVIEKGYGWQQ